VLGAMAASWYGAWNADSILLRLIPIYIHMQYF
jgi:hypothetical protein